jgi:hypothetical protein
VVPSQSGQIVCETPILKILNTKRTGGVAQSVGPEFKPQYRKKRVYESYIIFNILVLFDASLSQLSNKKQQLTSITHSHV